MNRPIEQASISKTFEEVTGCVGHEVLMEVDGCMMLIVGDPQGILD
jgi:hypothetical protein